MELLRSCRKGNSIQYGDDDEEMDVTESAEALVKPAPGSWTEEDLEILYEGVVLFGHKNIQKLADLLPEKTEQEIKGCIRNAATYGRRCEPGHPVLDFWIKVCKSECQKAGKKSYRDSIQVAQVFKYLSINGLIQTQPAPENCEGIDFPAAYKLLYNILMGYPLPQLNKPTANFVESVYLKLNKTTPKDLRDKLEVHLLKTFSNNWVNVASTNVPTYTAKKNTYKNIAKSKSKLAVPPSTNGHSLNEVVKIQVVESQFGVQLMTESEDVKVLTPDSTQVLRPSRVYQRKKPAEPSSVKVETHAVTRREPVIPQPQQVYQRKKPAEQSGLKIETQAVTDRDAATVQPPRVYQRQAPGDKNQQASIVTVAVDSITASEPCIASVSKNEVKVNVDLSVPTVAVVAPTTEGSDIMDVEFERVGFNPLKLPKGWCLRPDLLEKPTYYVNMPPKVPNSHVPDILFNSSYKPIPIEVVYKGKSLNVDSQLVRNGLSAISVKHCCKEYKDKPSPQCLMERNSFRNLHSPELSRLSWLHEFNSNRQVGVKEIVEEELQAAHERGSCIYFRQMLPRWLPRYSSAVDIVQGDRTIPMTDEDLEPGVVVHKTRALARVHLENMLQPTGCEEPKNDNCATVALDDIPQGGDAAGVSTDKTKEGMRWLKEENTI